MTFCWLLLGAASRTNGALVSPGRGAAAAVDSPGATSAAAEARAHRHPAPNAAAPLSQRMIRTLARHVACGLTFWFDCCCFMSRTPAFVPIRTYDQDSV